MDVHFMLGTVDREGQQESFRFDQTVLWPGVPRRGDVVDAPVSGPGDEPVPWVVKKVYWNANGSVGLYLGSLKLTGPHEADESYLERLRAHATRNTAPD